jgi:hypothetical protein
MHIKEHPPLRRLASIRPGFVALHLNKTERRTLRVAAAIAERARAIVASVHKAEPGSLDTELERELARLEFAANEIAGEDFFHIKDNEED